MIAPRPSLWRLRPVSSAALILTATAGFVVFAAAAAGWITVELQARLPGDPRPFVIPSGTPTARILTELAERRLIANPHAAEIYLRILRHGGTLKAGEYRFPEPHSSRAVLDAILEGRVVHHRITVPEGLPMEEIFPLFAGAGFGTLEEFRAAAASPAAIADLDPEAPDLEGYLFPETYDVVHGMGAARIVTAMVTNFRNVWGKGLAVRAASRGMSLRQTLTLAALVESEAKLPEERRLVAAVYANRLRLGMPLQADPTVIYTIKRRGEWDGNIQKTDLRLDDPYNTYRHRGLPPGPICNPGVAALAAALDPAPESYLYFVSRNDGSHVFSTNLGEHNHWVRVYQRQSGRRPRP